MIESEFGAKFQNWWNLKENGEYVNRFCDQAAFEYKVTNGGTFNLNTWRKREPQQEVELTKASGEEGVLWKISDMDIRTKPFDAFFLSHTPSFLVIWFEKHERFFIISVLEVPKQKSISFDYCSNRWKVYELNKPVKKHYDF
jgi:hypothetical protein